ncbi:MAG TPA: glycosyltransferase family 4 protein [Pyrinomonadaceae bacterium]|nr:glycosyltransferase family 4 protein [Pyrinomonadaceae bacterium]
MKVVLLALSGNTARDKLTELYPEAEIESISRTEFETGSVMKRLATLRARRPDVFAIATERLAWQRGQDLFMIFGALAGAREVVMIDAHGGLRRESRFDLLAGAPATLADEATTGLIDLLYSRRELLTLEHEKYGFLVNKTDRPRVVYLRATPGPGTQAGGAASHIKGVVEALARLGTEVQIISNDAIAGFDNPKLPFTIISPETVGATRALFDIHNNLVFTRAAVPLIERAAPDFIYQRYARFSWAGVVAASRIQRPLFLEYNGSEVWVGRHWDHVGSLDLLERYERLNLEAAARIFVVSEVERQNLEARGVPAAKIVVNPNGVDAELFRPGAGGAEVRRELGIGGDEVVAGFVGTFGPWHGVVQLAEAVKKVPANLRVRFLFVGSGSLYGEVERLLQAETASGRVIFTGTVAHERVPQLLDACDILVSPHVPLADGSDFFGSPTKIFEYMAMGKGIVASRLGQIGEVLSDNETALLVEPGNVTQLASAIIKLVETPGLCAQIGSNARGVAVQNHTWTRNAERVLEAYDNVG